MASKFQVIGDAVTFNTYLANLSHDGNSANQPVVEDSTPIKNELAAAIAWSRNAKGKFRGVLAGAFATPKKVVLHPITRVAVVGTEVSGDLQVIDANTIELRVFDAGYSLVDGFNFQIRIEVHA